MVAALGLCIDAGCLEQDDDLAAGDFVVTEEGPVGESEEPAEVTFRSGTTCGGLPGLTCHPLYQHECPAGEGCYPLGDGFSCQADVSGTTGEAGDLCFSVNGCNPGLFCADPFVLPGCQAPLDAGCCAEFVPLGGRCDPGLTSTPWYLPGMAPSECYARIGACVDIPSRG